MPVLARTLEAAGLCTVIVTMMPYWAEKIGVPRALAVEFPFGHSLGRPHDPAMQLRVIRQALSVLATAPDPGTIVHSSETWPVPQEEATKQWQPDEPTPIIKIMAPRLRQLLREQRESR